MWRLPLVERGHFKGRVCGELVGHCEACWAAMLKRGSWTEADQMG